MIIRMEIFSWGIIGLVFMSCKLDYPQAIIFPINLVSQVGCNDSLTGFSFLGSKNQLTKDYSSDSISNDLRLPFPYGRIHRAIPSFTISDGGKLYHQADVQVSGVTARDFTSTVSYGIGRDGCIPQELKVTLYPITPIADTGVNTCYDNTFIPTPDCTTGTEILSQDGALQDIPNSRNWEPISEPSLGEGVTADKLTGLVWKTCSEGMSYSPGCTGTPTRHSYDDAVQKCSDLNTISYAGLKSWRLPTAQELGYIRGYSLNNTDGLLDSSYFPNSPGENSIGYGFWTSTSDSNQAGDNFRLYFEWGLVLDNIDSVSNGTAADHRKLRCVSGSNPPIREWKTTPDGIQDLRSGLEWDRCVYGRTGTNCEIGVGIPVIWIEALKTCHNRGDGWRLPNANEALSLYDYSLLDPGLDPTYFPNSPNSNTASWTSTTSPKPNPNFTDAILIHSDGTSSIATKTSTYYVRCVRTSNE